MSFEYENRITQLEAEVRRLRIDLEWARKVVEFYMAQQQHPHPHRSPHYYCPHCSIGPTS
jgi:hypothetical protein